MSATIAQVTRTDVGTIRVMFAGVGRTGPARSDLTQLGRKAAAAEAHTLVGAAQNVTRASRPGHWTADYAPIDRTPKATAPQSAAPQSPTGDDDRLAYLERELARVTALLAASAPAAPAAQPVTPVSESTAKVHAKIAASAALNCKVCRDLGVIRLTPRDNGRWNFRSAKGAAETTRKQPCTACQVAHTA